MGDIVVKQLSTCKCDNAFEYIHHLFDLVFVCISCFALAQKQQLSALLLHTLPPGRPCACTLYMYCVRVFYCDYVDNNSANVFLSYHLKSKSNFYVHLRTNFMSWKNDLWCPLSIHHTIVSAQIEMNEWKGNRLLHTKKWKIADWFRQLLVAMKLNQKINNSNR